MNGIYGTSPYSRNLVTSSNVVELPVRQRHATVHTNQCYMDWKCFGIILGILAAASCALGVADVIYTYQTYMNNNCGNQTCSPNVLIFTWIAAGIWGSAPVFLFAIWLLRSSKMAYTRNMCLELMAFLTTFIFTTAIVVISALEVWKGAGVYYWPAQPPPENIVKLAIPLTIACLGFVEHVMCAIALYYFCCCHSGASATLVNSPPHMIQTTTIAHPPPPPAVVTTYQRPPTCQTACAPKPSCQTCPSPSFPQHSFFSGGFGAGGGNCTSCPRPITYNSQMAPNPAYNFYRR
jgi:hypothetical protein